MLIESQSQYYLKRVRAKAKMVEYHIPNGKHMPTEKEVHDLVILAIAVISDWANNIINYGEMFPEKEELQYDQLRFVAKFFDSYVESGLYFGERDYYLLLGSVVCYLCGLNGSSLVLASRVSKSVDLDASSLDTILCQILAGKNNVEVPGCPEEIMPLLEVTRSLTDRGFIGNLEPVIVFRRKIYQSGTDRELLFIDCLLAVLYVKRNNSAYNLLPDYSGIDYSTWHEILSNGTLVSELWPAQRALGEQGVYSGKSATIQLPTGAGKTKSIALIILSAFLSGRTKMAILVAPFRALCREISDDLSNAFSYDPTIHINELSDSLQMDLEESFFLEEDEIKKVFISTPEKLLFVIRQDESILKDVGLLIFDEGHLFDDYSRGITYELLISTIKYYSNKGSQRVLISAVIPNVSDINNWLTDGSGVVITNSIVKSTEKTIAVSEKNYITKYKRHLLNLYFVNSNNIDEEEFYVPGVISKVLLERKPRERKERFFPDINNSYDLAIAYALQLSCGGGVAIFCGRRRSVDGIISRCLEINSRGINVSIVSNNSDQKEIRLLESLINRNLGMNNNYSKASHLGIFAHHGGLPAGIRTSTEYAMQKGLIKVIACTSTLAQGVNLPIRYLIISNVYQGKESIRVRDFQNLIGRTGRSGMYTEGTVILTELGVYNSRFVPRQNYKWEKYKELFNPYYSEECISSLLQWIRPEAGKEEFWKSLIQAFEVHYPNGRFREEAFNIANSLEERELDSYERIIKLMLHSIESIESFLLFFLGEMTYGESQDEIHLIVAETLAYYLSTPEEKELLLRIIDLIGHCLVIKVDTPEKRYRYSKSLLGVDREILIEDWVERNLDSIKCSTGKENMLGIIFPLLIDTDNKIVNSCNDKKQLLELAQMWISGRPYNDIHLYANDYLHLELYKRRKYKPVELEDIIQLCDSFFSYDCTLTIAAISQSIDYFLDNPVLLDQIQWLAKSMKYGLGEINEIQLYELGFNDRPLVIELNKTISNHVMVKGKKRIINVVRKTKRLNNEVRDLLHTYPSYYQDKGEVLFNI